MVLDYCEHRPVNKNRPKKGGGSGLLMLVAVAALGIVFALGFVAGWFAAKGRQKVATGETQPAGEQERKDTSSSAQIQPQTTGNAGGVDPPLTFYNTLPKGNRAVIGSGLNPSKNVDRHPAVIPVFAPPATTGAHAVVTPAPPLAAQSVGPGGKAETLRPATGKDKKGDAAPQKYTVQLASYREKREAEAARDRLTAKGVTAFILESRLPDRGTWYRLRVGRALTQQQAGEIAARLGKEALVVTE